jgi:hypothetical protein
MTRAQGDTKPRERRQQAAERDAAREAKQSGTFQPRPQRAWRRKFLDAQGLPEQHDGRSQIPVLPFSGEFRVPGNDPSEPQDPSPP